MSSNLNIIVPFVLGDIQPHVGIQWGLFGDGGGDDSNTSKQVEFTYLQQPSVKHRC